MNWLRYIMKISLLNPVDGWTHKWCGTDHLGNNPQPNGETYSFFDGLDSPYAITSDGFVVLLDNEWTLFETRDMDN